MVSAGQNVTAMRTAGSPGISRQRIEWILDLRGALALYVVLHHAVLNIAAPGAPGPSWWVIDAVFGWGHMRVDVFFVLSAFCLALPMFDLTRNPGYRAFMLRRCARLLPAYYVAVVISYGLALGLLRDKTGTHWDVSVPVTGTGFATHLLLIHQWWPQFELEGSHPLWSIGAEFQLCVVLPLLVYACRRIGPWNMMSLTTALSYLVWRVTVATHFPDPSPWGASVYYLCLFGLGVGAASMHHLQGTLRAPRRGEIALMAGIAAGMVAWAAAQEVRNHVVPLQLMSFFVGLIVAGMLIWSRTPSRRRWTVPGTAGRVMRFIGVRSYSLYLIHAPLLQLTWLYIVRPMHLQTASMQAVAMMVLGTLVSLAGCWVLYEGVERWSGDHSRAIAATQLRHATFRPHVH